MVSPSCRSTHVVLQYVDSIRDIFIILYEVPLDEKGPLDALIARAVFISTEIGRRP